MRTLSVLKNQTAVALGNKKAELVIKNVSVLNVFLEKFEVTDLAISDGYIVGTGQYDGLKEIDGSGKFAVPGFIDSHVHIESSIVTPNEYVKVVAHHGTTAVITDPHEITNVLGEVGVEYMLKMSENAPVDVYVMAPSCVPATPFDENGATITATEIERLFKRDRVLGVAELMDYVGVLNGNDEVLKKLVLADKEGRVVDGHAPILTDKPLNAYINAGVSSDHECTDVKSAEEKLAKGQWIMVRQGTSCKNLEALIDLFKKPYCDRCLLATDDKHISELKYEGHVDHIIRLAIKKGANPINAYKMASYNAATHFGLANMGALTCGYKADFVLLNDINTVDIDSVYKGGVKLEKDLKVEIEQSAELDELINKVCNTVNLEKVSKEAFELKKPYSHVLGVVEGEVLTTREGIADKVDLEKDICKVAVLERFKRTGHVGIAFIKGYGLKKGAIATSVAHDSHNVIVVGASDSDMAVAVNRIIELQGGMVVVEDGKVLGELALPIAGLMCNKDEAEISIALENLKEKADLLGVNPNIDPFMNLSFLSLPVIPTLRIITRGVFDVEKFELI